MNPVQYVLPSPLDLPNQPTEPGSWILDVDDSGPTPRLLWRPRSDFPVIIHSSTGERGRLVRKLTHRLSDLPEFGKTTLTVESLISVDDSVAVYQKWDEGDWKVQS